MGRLIAQKEVASVLDGAFFRAWLQELAALMESERDHLTQLDAAIGDADHGLNMSRGFTAVRQKLDEGLGDPGPLLTSAGSTLISTVGGASGPLYGTAFRKAGKTLGDAPEVSDEALVEALEAGLDGIRALGAAALGDKTMVDALAPAVEALRQSIGSGDPLGRGAEVARAAADEGAKATIEMQARKGRASYLGPRSVGHQDPGATSATLLFVALERVSQHLDD